MLNDLWGRSLKGIRIIRTDKADTGILFLRRAIDSGNAWDVPADYHVRYTDTHVDPTSTH
jgi:hypothetical protein